MTTANDGFLNSPPEMQIMKVLDEIGEALRAKGITVEDLIESGREIRGEIARENKGKTRRSVNNIARTRLTWRRVV